jgi:hypothetical protein
MIQATIDADVVHDAGVPAFLFLIFGTTVAD